MGIFFALGALLAWGFGDFFIQKTTRAIGSWRALFFISSVGGIVLFPFIINDVPLFIEQPISLLILLTTTVIALCAALFDFEALRQGKIAIIEPVMGTEVPITVAISIIFLRESLTLPQILAIAAIFLGITLAVTVHHSHLHIHRRLFERGVLLAGLGAIGMALLNVMFGVSGRTTSPIFAIWFIHSLLAVVCIIYLFLTKEWRKIIPDLTSHARSILPMSILDNAAWLSYLYAVHYIPISIAIAISESYVALAVLLGLFINREKLKRHQLWGVALATVGIIILATITE